MRVVSFVLKGFLNLSPLIFYKLPILYSFPPRIKNKSFLWDFRAPLCFSCTSFWLSGGGGHGNEP